MTILQQHATNLKKKNLSLQVEARKNRQDFGKYYEENEQYSRLYCLRIKNLKKQENKSSDKVLEVVGYLFLKANINMSDTALTVHIVLIKRMKQ